MADWVKKYVEVCKISKILQKAIDDGFESITVYRNKRDKQGHARVRIRALFLLRTNGKTYRIIGSDGWQKGEDVNLRIPRLVTRDIPHADVLTILHRHNLHPVRNFEPIKNFL